MRDRPLATQHPNLNDYMPVNLDAWESSPNTVPLVEGQIFNCGSGPLSRFSFTREAQACYLLGQTMTVSRTESTLSDLHSATMDLQNFLKRLMDPATGTWGTFCGATSMTIRFVILPVE